MDDETLSTIFDSKSSKLKDTWKANLTLNFECQEERSFLAKKQHTGPLVIQKTLHPEGEKVCHGIIIHPPGGVAGGDALTLSAILSEGAQVLLTTPGAGKWYKANGRYASQHLGFELDSDACLEWLPQENILFDGSRVKLSANIELSQNANFAGWEILCFGRQAQKELWQTGSLHQKMTIRRDKKLIWQERARLDPDFQILKSLVGLRNNVVSASFVVAAGSVPQDILAASREVQPNLALDSHAKFGVTALPEIFSVRYVGQSAQNARQYFEQLWQILRPWYAGRDVTRPRIWNT